MVKQRLSRDDDLDQHAKGQVKTNREDLTNPWSSHKLRLRLTEVPLW